MMVVGVTNKYWIFLCSEHYAITFVYFFLVAKLCQILLQSPGL